MGTVFLATMTEDRPWARTGERVALKIRSVDRVGEDLRIVARIA